MIWVYRIASQIHTIMTALDVPQPSGARRGTAGKLVLPLLLSIDVEVEVTVVVWIDNG